VKPWEPQKGESLVAYQAFVEYRDMGDSRSQDAVSVRLGKSRQLMSRWAAKWKWVARVTAYAAHLEAIEQRGRERAIEKKAEDWATTELELARDLIAKGKAMLAFPLARQRSKDGQTIVEPADWRMVDAAKMLAEGVKMERLARGEATDRVSIVAAKDALQAILTETGLPEDKARQIVAARFGISEQELISTEAM
jgi:hypothetical protein